MARLLPTLLAPALLLLPAGASGQSTPSDPYVRSRVDRDDAASHCLYWAQPTLVWQQSRAGNPDTGGGALDAVRHSFGAWQEVLAGCGNLELREGEPTDERTVGFASGGGDNRNVVLFRTRGCSAVVAASDRCWADGTCANAHDCWDHDEQTIAVTLTTYDGASGILRDADIELNAAPHLDGARFVFSASAVPACGSVATHQCIPTDVQNTVTHEVGHLLGLDHTLAAGSTMNPSTAPGDTANRTVDPGSRDFVCSVYPLGLPSQDCVALAPAATLGRAAPGCSGAGGGQGGGRGLLVLLAVAVLGRLGWRRA